MSHSLARALQNGSDKDLAKGSKIMSLKTAQSNRQVRHSPKTERTREEVAASVHADEIAKRNGKSLIEILARIRAEGFFQITTVDVRSGTHWLKMTDPDGRPVEAMAITEAEANCIPAWG